MSKILERAARRRRSKSRQKYYWYVFYIVFAAAIAGGGFYAYNVFFANSTATMAAVGHQQVKVTVEPGMTTREIAQMLKDKGVINSVYLFRLCAMVEKLDNSLKAGEYLLDTGMFELDAVKKLASGEVSTVKFTIPEGYTIDQIAKFIEEKHLGSAEKFKAAAKDFAPYPYMKAVAGQKYRAEGFLFPDTYSVAKNMSEEQLLKIMVDQFDKRLTPEMRDKLTSQGRPIYDTIILASLIEKEAKRADERTTIAGVFLNRLKKDMPLQSCATIQYLFEEPKEELSIKDTEIVSPYNTYRKQGLPPGPIGNAGIESINAAINPATTDYLYFVADKQGKHTFSATYEQHLAAINKVR